MKEIKKSEEKFTDKIGIFLPVSFLLILWYFFVLALITLSFLYTIIIICYRQEQFTRNFRHNFLPILVISMFIDILISFNTGYIKNGKIIQGRKEILKNYIFSVYFWIDLFSFVIALLELLFQRIFFEEYKFLQFLIYIKIVKTSEFDNLIKKYIIKSPGLNLLYEMLKNLILLIIVCNVIGSFFFYLDLVLIDDGWYSHDQLWVYSSYCYPNIIDLPFIDKYTYSFYYAVVTMSGTAYGDLVPLNQSETAYTFGTVALPMVIFAYLFTVIYNSIADSRAAVIQARKYKKMAKYYFTDLGVSTKLKNRLLNYLSYVYEKKHSINNDFFEEIPPSTRDEYIKTIVGSSYDFTIFFNISRPQFDLEMIKQLIMGMIEEEAFPQRERLISKNRKKLYFIHSGRIIQAIYLKNIVSKPLKNKEFFGSFTFFTGQIDTDIVIETNSFCVCQSIDYDKFLPIVKQKQVLKQSYHIQRDQLLLYEQYSIIKKNCFFCDEQTHKFQTCPKLKQEVDITKGLKVEAKRNELTYGTKFIRKDVISRKTKKVKNEKKEAIFQEGRKQKSNIGIQTDNMQNEEQLKDFEGVYSWRIFYPNYSFY